MIENSIVYRDLKKYNFFRMSKAEGPFIWDREGKRYIDFTSGWNVTNLGWNHPEVNEAVITQTKKNVHGLLWGSDPIQEEYALKLTAALPDSLNACAKATGGTEAVEESIKIARAATGRKKIIGFRESYHGQLFASLALGYPAESVERIAPLVPEFIQLDWPAETNGKNDRQGFIATLETALEGHEVAALITEPGIITGWGSTAVAYAGFIRDIRELTMKYGTLLIVDEVGTGFSRTGKLFGIEHENVVPDMLVLAKGISNGAVAIGTVVGEAEIFRSTFSHTSLISTFGWTPVACAAALKTLEVHQRDRVWELAEAKSRQILDKLKPLVGQVITGIHGRGLEIGFGVADEKTAKKVIDAAFKKGLHLVIGGGKNIQLMPPITIPAEVLDEGLEILLKVLGNIVK